MQRASKAPRIIAGYGDGAATPSPSTQEPTSRRRINAQTQRAAGWKPSVQRSRPTTAPSAPAQTPINAEGAPQGTAAPTAGKPTKQPKMKTPTRMPTGSAAKTGVWSSMEGAVSAAKARAWGRVPSPIRKISSPAKGVYSGGMGKLNLVLDGAIVAQAFGQMINPQSRGKEIYDSASSQYASLQDAEGEARWESITQVMSVGADNMAQMVIQRGAQSVVRSIGTRLLGAAFATSWALGPLGFAVTMLALMAIDQLMSEKTVEEQMNPWIGLSQSGSEALTTMQLPASGVLTNTVLPTLSPTLRSIGWSDTTKNSPLEVQHLKEERNPTIYRGAKYWDENDNEVRVEAKVYESFGRRKDEVTMLLDLGYFITPEVDDKGEAVYTTWTNPVTGQEMKYREFQFDGIRFQNWFESTDWTFGKGGIKERMDGLPPIDEQAARVLLKNPITAEEKNIALESWYNMIRNDAALSPQR